MAEENEETTRDVLAQAFDAEEEETEEVVEEEEDEEQEDESTDDESTDDEDTDESEEEDEEEPQDEPEEKSEETAEESVEPPHSWSAVAREGWKDIPPSAQKYINEREAQMVAKLSESAEERKFGNEVRNALQPYQAVIRMEGANDVQAVAGLAHTAATLRLGSPQDKAKQIVSLINHYGVDIDQLDEQLSQTVSGDGGQLSIDPNVQNYINQTLAPVQQFMTTAQQTLSQRQQESQNSAMQSLEQFAANNEFYNDVKLDMADLMEMAANRGETMTLEQAYQKACQMSSEVQGVISQRTEQKATEDRQKRLRDKKRRSTSLASGGAGQPAKDEDTLRDTISRNFDAAVEG